jgi:hypothetical protein
MYSIVAIHKKGITSTEQSVIDEEFPKLLEAVHNGELKTVQSKLAKYPTLLNRADKPQGNTLLHYAVAQHDLTLIELLIDWGAESSTKNQQGESAATWYEELVASRYHLEKVIDSIALRQLIKKNEVQLIAEWLDKGLSVALRFSRGETLLHWAVELQQPAVVQLILKRISKEYFDRLLNLKNSRGDTPLALAWQFYQHETPAAQEIFTILQKKQRATAAGESTSMIQPLLVAWPPTVDKKLLKKTDALSKRLKKSITSADFRSLNPLREVICQLAYMTCFRALNQLSELINQPAPLSIGTNAPPKQALLQSLLHNLFGNWSANTQVEVQKKLESIVNYLTNLMKQQQIEQVIHFSNQKSQAKGWNSVSENKIYLNPTVKTNLIGLVATLINEAAHIAHQSYDFATLAYSIDSQWYTISFNQACQLASTGVDVSLTPEQTKLFQLWQLLQPGDPPKGPKKLNHWMALNSTHTQILAILLLATLPEGYATVDEKQQILLIQPQFLSEKYLNRHPVLPHFHLTTPPPSEPLQQATASLPLSLEEQTGASLTDQTTALIHSTPLQQAMVSLPSSLDGQPGQPRTEPTNRSVTTTNLFYSWREQ